MRRLLSVLVIAMAFSTTATALEIAICTTANWWSQAAADREMQEVADHVTAVPVLQFAAGQYDALADWVAAHTGDGVSDLLILCGQCPDAIYPAVNAQPDGSLLELFLDDGNCVINTGDWIFYIGTAGTNGTAALPSVMDIPSMEMWDDDTPVTVTAEGQKYTPSLANFSTDRAIHLDALTNDWYAELILALAADGNRAEPVILRNSVTGGRIGVFFQTASQDDDPRGEVMSEWINNWYLKVVANPRLAGSPSPADEATDVPREVILSWTAGMSAATHDVYFGTAFDDVNAVSRANPMGVLVSQGSSATSYDPSTARLRDDVLVSARTRSTRASTTRSTRAWSGASPPSCVRHHERCGYEHPSVRRKEPPENTVNGLARTPAISTDREHRHGESWRAALSRRGFSSSSTRVHRPHQMLVWNYLVQPC